MGTVGGALAIDIVLVQDDLHWCTGCAGAATTVAQSRHSAPGHHLSGPVPDDGVVGSEDLR